MKRSLFWALAVLITIGSAFFQRVTGPSYPLRGKVEIGGQSVGYKLPRSADTTARPEIRLTVVEPYEGYIEYRRVNSDDAWLVAPLQRQGAELKGPLPVQPSAGKLAYKVFLTGGNRTVGLAGGKEVVLRFKDPVPAGLLIAHILIMFAGMLMAAAAGLAAFDKKRDPRRFVIWTIALLFAGGFILGPLVQKAAFGVYWSGFPVGSDLTDTKAFVSFLFWIAAWAAGRKGRPARVMTAAAAVVTLFAYLIPHSMFGSELHYTGLGK